MAIAAGQQADGGRAGKAARFHVPSAAFQHRVPRSGEAGDMRHLASGDEGETRARGDAQQFLEPLAGDLFHQRGGGPGGVEARVLVPRGGEPVGCEGRGNAAAHHPTVEAPAGRGDNAARGIAHQIFDHLRGRRAVVQQRTRQARAKRFQRRRGRNRKRVQILNVRERVPSRRLQRFAEG